MSAQARIAPVTDLLDRHVKVYLVTSGVDHRHDQVRSFDAVREVLVDVAAMMPDEVKPLLLTLDEAESLYEALRERLAHAHPQPQPADWWKRRFEDERSLNRALVTAIGRRVSDAIE